MTQPTQQTIGLFTAIGMLLSTSVQTILGLTKAIEPAVQSVANLTESAELCTRVVRTKCEIECTKELDELAQLVASLEDGK